MELISNFLKVYGFFALLLAILQIALLWLFLYSAISCGVKKGIINAHNLINSNSNSNQDTENTHNTVTDDSSKQNMYAFLLIFGMIAVGFIFYLYIKAIS